MLSVEGPGNHWPALVAFPFALVHALVSPARCRRSAYPQRHLAIALATFNLGVEAGSSWSLRSHSCSTE